MEMAQNVGSRAKRGDEGGKPWFPREAVRVGIRGEKDPRLDRPTRGRGDGRWSVEERWSWDGRWKPEVCRRAAASA